MPRPPKERIEPSGCRVNPPGPDCAHLSNEASVPVALPSKIVVYPASARAIAGAAPNAMTAANAQSPPRLTTTPPLERTAAHSTAGPILSADGGRVNPRPPRG